MTFNRHRILTFFIIFISYLSPVFTVQSAPLDACKTQGQSDKQKNVTNIRSGKNIVTFLCSLTHPQILSFNSQAITKIDVGAQTSAKVNQLDSSEFAFSIPEGDSKLTLTLHSDFTVPLRFRLTEPDAYDMYKQQHNAIMYSFLSFCLALALYVLILGRSLHSSYFYTYAAYITVTALFFATQERIFSFFLAQNSWLLHYKFATVLAGASVFIGQLFISGLLDFKNNLPNALNNTITWLARVIFVVSLSSLAVPISLAKAVQLTMGYITLALMFSMLIGMVLAFKKRVHCSGLVLLSSVVMLASMVMRIIFADYSEFLTRYALVIAIMLDAVILSFAISEKVKLLYAEKVKATEKANRDPLTGVYNKRGWYQTVETSLTKLEQHGGTIALLYIDMDKFKSINDNFGHDVGDQALLHLTSVLHHQTAEADVIGRVGGDEFVILAYFENTQQAKRFAERISNQIAAMTIHIDEQTLTFSASLGYHLITEPVESIEQAMQESDSKMYEAKSAKTKQLGKVT